MEIELGELVERVWAKIELKFTVALLNISSPIWMGI